MHHVNKMHNTGDNDLDASDVWTMSYDLTNARGEFFYLCMRGPKAARAAGGSMH